MIKRLLKKEYIIILIVAFIFVLVSCGSTSPLYNLYHSYYTGFDASEAMVIAKGWLNGLIPYKDLYTTNGPMMIIMNTIGWFIGGRYGIMVIEWLCIALTLILMYRLLRINNSNMITSLLLLFTLLVMFGCISNGNNELEYMLLLYTGNIYLYYRIDKKPCKVLYTLLGLSTGLGITISPLFSIPLIGLSLIALFQLSDIKKYILYYFIGLLIPLIIVSIYLYINNALITMLYASTIDRISPTLTDQTELLHKVVKVIPLILIVIYGIMNIKKENNFSLFLIVFGITLTIILMIVDVNWYNYYPLALCIPLCFIDKININKIINACYVVLVFAIFWTPIRNYIEYTFFTDFSGYESLLSDLSSNMENNDATFYGINTPSFFYLETNTMPSYQYFTNQTDIQDADTYQDFYNYLIDDCESDIIIYKFSGFVESEIGNYDIETFYYQGNEVYAVYTYNADE